MKIDCNCNIKNSTCTTINYIQLMIINFLYLKKKLINFRKFIYSSKLPLNVFIFSPLTEK